MPIRSRGVRIALLLTALLSALLVGMVVVLTPWDPLPGAEIIRPPVGDYFTSQQVARSDAFYDAAKWPSWIGLAVSLAVAVALGFSPLGRRLVATTRSRVKRWWVQVIVLVVAFLLAQSVVSLPFRFWSAEVARDYGLNTQPWGSWALDQLKSLGITIVLTSIGLLVLVGLARRFTRTWFIPAAAGAGGLVIVLSFAYPVVFEPVFNNFTPMRDGPLRSELLRLAADDGINASEVLVADASRRTTALNAYVSGFGATKRIVVYDNLLKSAPDKQVELIVAHELGHAANRDVLVGTLEGSLAAALGIVALFLALRPDVLRRRVGAESAGDAAVVPVVLGLAILVGFVALPVQNTVSRHIEARADEHSLQLTADARAFVAMQQRLAVTNLDHLEPNPILEFWFASHPTTLDRIGMALAWEKLHPHARPDSGTSAE